MNQENNRRRRNFMLRREPDAVPIPRKTRVIGMAVSIGAVALATVIVVGSLYNIQIRNGEMFSRYASDQQLLDTTIQATRGEIYDATGKVLASTSVVWDIWCDPSYSTALYNSQEVTSTNPDTGKRRSLPSIRWTRPPARKSAGTGPAAGVGGTASAWTAWTPPPRHTWTSTRRSTRP